MWQSVALTGGCILSFVIIASLLSIRRVIVLEAGDSISRVNRARKPIHCDFHAAGVQKHFAMARASGHYACRLRGPAGELTFIVGPSGCGKTTLLSVITGCWIQRGEVELFGAALAVCRHQRILFRRENVGFVFQQFNLLPR